MIASYVNNGKGSEALQLFDRMKKSGIEPDDVAFVDVLSACTHAGLVGEGYFHLRTMIRDYGIEPGQKHYASMVDLLGRAGRLERGRDLLTACPQTCYLGRLCLLLAKFIIMVTTSLGRWQLRRFWNRGLLISEPVFQLRISMQRRENGGRKRVGAMCEALLTTCLVKFFWQ